MDEERTEKIQNISEKYKAIRQEKRTWSEEELEILIGSYLAKVHGE